MKIYDFGLNWDKDECLFTDLVEAGCRKKGLSFVQVTRNRVREAVKGLESNQLRIKVLLDTEATYDVPGDLFARVCYAVKDSGGVVINDPDRTRMAVDKAVMYYELLDSGINTPYTVIVRNWEPTSFRLTAEERARLGIPFVIKPGCGWGHQGVVYNASGTIREIAEARNYDRGDNFLLQEKVNPLEWNRKRAWFRVFHVFDKIIPCWWDDRNGTYEHVTGDEFKALRLATLAKYATRIGGMTRMTWFSTEIAMDKKNDQQRFLSIDYVNDQCDMTARSESPDGVPDNIVRVTANSIVDEAYRLIFGKDRAKGKKYTILLKKTGFFGIRGLGYPPDLLVHIPFKV